MLFTVGSTSFLGAHAAHAAVTCFSQYERIHVEKCARFSAKGAAIINNHQGHSFFGKLAPGPWPQNPSATAPHAIEDHTVKANFMAIPSDANDTRKKNPKP